MSTSVKDNPAILLQYGGTLPLDTLSKLINVNWDKVGKSVMWLGDSITAKTQAVGPLLRGEAYFKLFPTYTNLNVVGAFVVVTRPIGYNPAGDGTLTYTKLTNTLTWTAFGDTRGTPVTIPTSGFYTLPSGNPMYTLVVGVISRFKPTVDATDTITIAGGPMVLSGQASVGFTGWLENLLQHPFDTSLNYSITGIKASDWLQASSQWESVYTDITNIHLGTNDVSDRTSAAQCLLDIAAIVEKRQAIGSRCILWSLLPYNSRATLANQAVVEYIQGLRRIGQTYNCDVADAWQYVADPTTTVTWASGLSADGLHPGSKAAYIMAKRAGVPIYNKYVQNRMTILPAPVLYDATNAPYGNLAINGNLTGTAGIVGTGVSGTVPTSWNALRSSGSVLTIVATAPDAGSPILRTDGKLSKWARFACTNTGGVAGETFQIRGSGFMTLGNFSAGDLVVLEGEIQISGTGIQYINAYAGAAGQGRYTYGIYGDSTTNGDVSDLDGDTVYIPFKSAPLKVLASDTNFNIFFEIHMLANGVANFDIGQSINFHKVPY